MITPGPLSVHRMKQKNKTPHLSQSERKSPRMPSNLDEIWKDGQESREPSLDSQDSEGPGKAELSLLSIGFVSLLINAFFIFLIIKE